MAYIKPPYDFTLDFKQKIGIYPITLIQDDSNSNQFNIQITSDGIPVDLTGNTVTITFKKSDETVVVGQCTLKDAVNGIVSYILGTNELACVGSVEFSCEAYGTGDTRSSTFPAKFKVVNDLDDGTGVPSTTEYTVLTGLISDFNEATFSEAEQKTYEQLRKDAESSRIANEDQRIANNAAYTAAENQRITNENQRISNNTAYGQAEAVRVANENQRIANNAAYGQAETTRQSNEQQRVNAENQRNISEQNRVVEFDGIKDEYEVIKDDYNTASNYTVINQSWGSYVATADNTTTFILPSGVFNPVVDCAWLSYRGVPLNRDESYTQVGSQMSLLGFSINTGEKIDFRIDKAVINQVPGSDGAMLMNKSVTQPKLSQDIQDKLNLVPVIDGQLADIMQQPEQYGAKGDGVTDDTISFVNLINNSKNISLSKGKVYKLSDVIQLSENTIIYCNDATLNFYLDGNKKALLLNNKCRLIGKLTVNVYVPNTQSVGDGVYQCPIVIGDGFTGDGKNDISIDCIQVYTQRNNGNGILITGDSHNIEINTIIVPDNSSIGIPVLLHWGGDTNLTKHPYNIDIKNVKVGKNTYSSDGCIVFLSAVYNVNIDNIMVDEAGRDVISIFAGDYGAEYADPSVKPLVLQNININNVACKLTHRHGFNINLSPRLLVTPIYKSNYKVANANLVGDGTINVGDGIEAYNCDGGNFGSVCVTKFAHGVVAQQSAKNIKFNKITSFGNNGAGFYASNGTVNPENIIVEELIAYNNGINIGSSGFKSGAYIGASKRITVKKSTLGIVGETSQLYAINVDTNAIDAIIEDNHCLGVATGGVAYSLGTGTSYGIVKKFVNNTAENGITLKGGLLHVPYAITPSGNKICCGTSAPTSGTWAKGDEVINSFKSSGQYDKFVCISPGTPGTWTGLNQIP